jgi:hypothetical protein
MPTLEVRQGRLQEVLSDAEVLFDWKFIQEEFSLAGRSLCSER